MALTNEFVDGELKGGSSGVYNRERERERENRAEQSAVGANVMVATVVGLSERRLVGSTFAQPACFADDIQRGEVQRPADDDQRGGCNGLLSWRPRISSLTESNSHPKTEANYAS
jgi:hypothetical protein